MVVDAQSFLWLWVYAQLKLPMVAIAVGLVVLCLHRRLPAFLVVRRDGLWRITPLALALITTAMLAVHYAFDVNPTIAGCCATSFGLLWLLNRAPEGPGRVIGPLSRRVVALAVWTVFFSGWIAVAADPFDRAAIAVWAALLLVTARWLAPWIGAGELALLRVLAVIPMNLLPALLPLWIPPPGGQYLGAGLAYSFCEVPNHGTVYASLPVCGSVRAGYDECRDGRIVEYDLATRRAVAEHRFFSPSFHGRLELLVCLNDQVQVGVQASSFNGESMIQSAMAFSVADPRQFTPVVAGKALGVTIASDAAHDAVFYAGEFTNLLVRYDRRTGQFDDTASQDLVRPWHHPVTLEAYGNSIMIAPHGIHPGRNRLYVEEWMGGNDAYAVDLTTLRVVARYAFGSGAGLGISVDADRDRLFVSSLWGLEVFDLTTDRLIARKRIGLGNRPVVVDAARNRLYVSSMVEGKVRILDRDTLDVIGQIPIGMGSRYPHLTLDGKYLLASSTAAHYVWDADALGLGTTRP
ncbi:MAG: hypothetical protein ABI080_09400, partial [Candidatus Binatia bacterium]